MNGLKITEQNLSAAERIQLLAEQAKASVPMGLAVEQWIAEYNRIFAESIITECALVANEYMTDIESVNYGVGLRLKKHFGITE